MSGRGLRRMAAPTPWRQRRARRASPGAHGEGRSRPPRRIGPPRGDGLHRTGHTGPAQARHDRENDPVIACGPVAGGRSLVSAATAIEMPMFRPLLLRLARRIEPWLERIGARPGADPVLEPYVGFASPEGVVLRGRVLTHLRRATPDPRQSRWVNLRQMVSLFLTDEVAGVEVRAQGATARSDGEGFVDLIVPARPGPWAQVEVEIAGAPDTRTTFPARVPGPEARWLVISDIDDTVIKTGAHSLARNLWTTFTGSALTRSVHADAGQLLRAMARGDRNPVFYVSSSPWNLHGFLVDLLAHHDLPRGPMFLRDLGVSRTGIGASHLDHKGAAIDATLAASPDLDCWLVGDSGQYDAQVYRDAVLRHAGRVRGVALREPQPGAGADDAQAIAAIEAAGVPCFHGPSLDGALRYWGLE